MAKDKSGHGSEKGRRFEAGGHIIEHAVTPKTGQKMFVVGYTGNSYKDKKDAVSYANKYPTVSHRMKHK